MACSYCSSVYPETGLKMEDNQAPATHDRNSKKTPTRIHAIRNEQIDFDHALAMALQEQERTLRLLATLVSDDDSESGGEEEEEGDDEFFVRGEAIDAESGFLEQEERRGDNESELEFLLQEEDDEEGSEGRMEEDDIDPDELSYEELMALGEIVGHENKGLSGDEISKLLRPCTSQICNKESKLGIDRCVICQVEHEEGEMLAALPCEHPYHSECISKWLQIKKICPICSSEVLPLP